MRYLFKTDYRQDLSLWRHRGDLFWYGPASCCCSSPA